MSYKISKSQNYIRYLKKTLLAILYTLLDILYIILDNIYDIQAISFCLLNKISELVYQIS